MTEVTKDLALAQTISLMNSYTFDTNGDTTENLIQQWLENYDSDWIYLATIEALYQGRYKAISIEQIMEVWSRIGKPNTHFSGDFRRVISRKLPRHLAVEKDNKFSSELIASDKSVTTVGQVLPNQDLPLVETKIIPPFTTEAKNKRSPNGTTSASAAFTKTPSPSNSRGITTFQPMPDGSSFFLKLKAFATGQFKSS